MRTWLSRSKGWVSEKLSDCAICWRNRIYLFDGDIVKVTYSRYNKGKFILRNTEGIVRFSGINKNLISVIPNGHYNPIPWYEIYNIEKI